MEDYGYIYNKLAKDVKKYSSINNINIKKTDDVSYEQSHKILIFVCFIIFLILLFLFKN